jgi:hypothetical protein
MEVHLVCEKDEEPWSSARASKELLWFAHAPRLWTQAGNNKKQALRKLKKTTNDK